MAEKKKKKKKKYVHPYLEGEDTSNLSLPEKLSIIIKKDIKKEKEAWKTTFSRGSGAARPQKFRKDG